MRKRRSDTFVPREGHQNPATYGTFPSALSTYAKEVLFTLEEAVRKMTGGAAERLRWKDRGWVRAGCAADLVVFDAATLQDTATTTRHASRSASSASTSTAAP